MVVLSPANSATVFSGISVPFTLTPRSTALASVMLLPFISQYAPPEMLNLMVTPSFAARVSIVALSSFALEPSVTEPFPPSGIARITSATAAEVTGEGLLEFEEDVEVEADGLDGTEGSDGIEGSDGSDGSIGLEGVDGKDGSEGLEGFDGPEGSEGLEGLEGSEGVSGVSGVSGVEEAALTVTLKDCST